MKRIEIRNSKPSDIDAIMAVYGKARDYMRRTGNMHQWINGYPSAETVKNDIDSGVGYVGVDESGEIRMAFALIIGDDPTYEKIYDGEWPDRNPYGTIHRLASDGKYAGMLERCVDFGFTRTGTIRLDTHEDNLPMQRAATRLGFRRCGIIICNDGTPRIAYQLNRSDREKRVPG